MDLHNLYVKEVAHTDEHPEFTALTLHAQHQTLIKPS